MKLKNIIAAFLIPLNSLLLFFLFFDDRLLVPAWLQVFGRMHPLVLHFPIVLILLYGVCILFIPGQYKTGSGYYLFLDVLLLLGACTAAITALMGLLLAREPGYDPENIAWHKYTGALTSFALFAFYNFHSWFYSHKIVANFSVISIMLLVIIAGHLGADITHGENFITAPVTPQDKKIIAPFDEAFVYADLVEPILQEKCQGCHNSVKAKGDLMMDTKEFLQRGGKNGKLWDTTKPGLGLMMQRIHLPEDEKEHMPPTGKPQLTEEEITILYAWIKTGADFDKRAIELLSTDTLRVIAEKKLKKAAEENYDFAAADEKQIQKLSNNNRVITPLALNSPALAVTFYNKPFYNTNQLEELNPISSQVTELNLDNMPVKDEDIKLIGNFKNLRKLNLSFTSISGNTLSELKNLPFLKNLSLSGTAVKSSQITELSSSPKLRNVYLWNTAVTTDDAQQLTQRNKNINYITGFKGDTMILKLTPPINQNEEQIITEPVALKLKHYVNGATIRYTLDGKDPDSISSPVYKNDVNINSNITVRAKAFKPGWISSDVMEQHFFKSTYVPDSAVLLTPPDDKYKASGAQTLIDLDKSDLNFANGKWLGYRNNACEALLLFNKPVNANSITLSMMQDIGGYLMPPAQIEVWAGSSEKALKKITVLVPKQPTKESDNKQGLVYDTPLTKETISCIKLLIRPVNSLPAWHPGKGDKGWIFIDEVFVN